MQKKWYALSPRNQLMVGSESVIEGYIDDAGVISFLQSLVDRYYPTESDVPIADFGYPFISAIAARYIPDNVKPKPIRHLYHVLTSLSPVEGDDLTTQEVTMRFYNSMIVAELPVATDEKVTAERILSAFKHGELLIYGRDVAKLSTNKVKDVLPGILNYLLNGETAKKSASQQYLRGGQPHTNFKDEAALMTAPKHALCTWTLEDLYEDELEECDHV